MSVAFSPDGKLILTGSADKTAQLWDAATGQRMGTPLVHQDDVWSVAFSPDGRSILTGSEDGMARLWDGDPGQPIGRLLEHGSTMAGSWHSAPTARPSSPRDRDGKVRRWDVASGRPLGQPWILESAISAMALSPDGKTIVTGSDDKTGAAVGRRHRSAARPTHGPFGLG